MPEIISEEALIIELNHFRSILSDYDFTEISNVIFFDVESLNCYLKMYMDNPFERQYKELEIILDRISAYLPSTLSNDTMDILSDILDDSYCNMDLLRNHLLFNVKLDFIERVKDIKTEEEWQGLLAACNQLRLEQLTKLEYEVKV